MIARGAGRLIGIASLSSFVGLQEVSAYTASKSAVAGLTRALAVEWAPLRRHRQRHRAGRVQDGSQRHAPRGAARAGVPAAHADEAVRPPGGARRRRGLPGLRRVDASSPASSWSWTAGSSRAESTSEPGHRHQRRATTSRRRSRRSTPGQVIGADRSPSANRFRAATRCRCGRFRSGASVIKYGNPSAWPRPTIPAGRARAHAQRARARADGATCRAPNPRSTSRGSPSRPTIGGTRERRAAPGIPGLPPAGRARRRAQPSPRRPDGDLLRRSSPSASPRRSRRSAPRCRTRPGAASSGPTCTRRTRRWRRIAAIRTSARSWSSRSAASRSWRSTWPTPRAAPGKPAHIVAIQSEGGTVRATARANRDRAGARRRARAHAARDVRRLRADPVREVRRIRLHVGARVESGARARRGSARRSRRRRGARRDRGDHGGRAPARRARAQPRHGEAPDPRHQPRRNRRDGARPRHPRHAAVAGQHPRRPDDDRGEVARRDAQGRGADAPRGRGRPTRRRSPARG